MSLFQYTLVTCCLAFAQVTALPAPKPIEGCAFMSSKNFTSSVGNYEFILQFPQGWGVGEVQASPDGTGHFFSFR